MRVIIDPMGSMPIPPARLLRAGGLLPDWVTSPDYPDMNLKDKLTKHYGFGELTELKGGTITPEGAFQFPQDPDQYPLISIVRKEEQFLLYEHAIVAILQPDGSSFITRID